LAKNFNKEYHYIVSNLIESASNPVVMEHANAKRFQCEVAIKLTEIPETVANILARV